MSTSLSRRAMNPLQQCPWFSKESQATCDKLNVAIEAFNAEMTELVNLRAESVESASLLTQDEIEEFRQRVFALLQTEIHLRAEITAFLKSLSADHDKETTRLEEKFQGLEARLGKKFEAMGYLPLNTTEVVPGAWTLSMVRNHPDHLNHFAAIGEIRAHVEGRFLWIREHQEFSQDAEKALKEMAMSSLPTV